MLGLEYSILIDSYTNSNMLGGVYDISYTSHRPSALAYYVFCGNDTSLNSAVDWD
jgi:hypothetical protein